jgi:hypothetical protein
MVEIVPFRPEHLAAIRLQGVQASAQPMMTVEHGRQLIEQPGSLARTLLVDGVPMACAGLIELWRGRAYAWAYLSEGWERFARAVHRACLDNLQACRWRRVEMAVDVRYPQGKRWAWHLGFEFEGVARAFTPDGRDCEIWARVAS